jgi:hypothetical protein
MDDLTAQFEAVAQLLGAIDVESISEEAPPNGDPGTKTSVSEGRLAP